MKRSNLPLVPVPLNSSVCVLALPRQTKQSHYSRKPAQKRQSGGIGTGRTIQRQNAGDEQSGKSPGANDDGGGTEGTTATCVVRDLHFPLGIVNCSFSPPRSLRCSLRAAHPSRVARQHSSVSRRYIKALGLSIHSRARCASIWTPSELVIWS